MIGKMILPWFGGSAAVWSTCLLFFQAALLGGYLYAHWSTRSLTPRRQALLHLVLIAGSLVLLRIPPSAAWKPAQAGDPSGRILLLLAATIGLPYVVLATTSPLLQAWYVALRPGTIPYRLFALSNFGSLLALFSFPVLVEPLLTTHAQAFGWSGLYAGFVILCGAVCWRMFRAAPQPPPRVADDQEADAPPPWKIMVFWIALPACATALLLSITTHLSQNVAPIPLLWVLPLGVYLLSFIFCFENEKLYHRGLFLPLLVVGSGVVGFSVYFNLGNPNLRWAIPADLATLFICCMVCHGELVRLRPHPRRLTSFYLMIALGGALGGLFVAIVAPRVFHTYVELDVALVACGALASAVLWIAPGAWPERARLHAGRIAVLMALGALAGFLGFRARHDKLDLSLVVWGALTAVVLWIGPAVWSGKTQVRITRAAIGVFTLVLAAYLGYRKHGDDGRFAVSVRNFYAVLRVEDIKATADTRGVRRLISGTIDHGEQLTKASERRTATSYYGPDSGMGRAIRYFQEHSAVRVGVVGLGAGVTAAYCRPGDVFRFYEINPLDLNVATTWFTFFNDCPGDHQVLLGDARLTMERQTSQQFDVLAVDAFSSDSIPVHLLTREAIALYFRHLKPGGILAVHVSNRYLNLVPVVARNARDLGKTAMDVDDENESEDFFSTSDWVLVSADRQIFGDEVFKTSATVAKIKPGLRPWTDDYSNLFQILKLPAGETD